jgi:hypothetical protein
MRSPQFSQKGAEVGVSSRRALTQRAWLPPPPTSIAERRAHIVGNSHLWGCPNSPPRVRVGIRSDSAASSVVSRCVWCEIAPDHPQPRGCSWAMAGASGAGHTGPASPESGRRSRLKPRIARIGPTRGRKLSTRPRWLRHPDARYPGAGRSRTSHSDGDPTAVISARRVLRIT